MTDAHTGTEPTPSTFNTAVGVVLLYGELALLAKRIVVDVQEGHEGGPVPYGGYWSPFAGAVEEGESPIAAGAREVWEEAGKKVEPHLLTYIKEIPQEGGSFILYAYELEKLFHPKLNYEHTESGYFKIEHLHSSPCPMCPQIVSALQDFNSRRRRAGW